MKKITLFLMLITAFVSAQNTKVARSIAGSSSIESTSNSFQIKGTLGQLAVGVSAGSEATIASGYWGWISKRTNLNTEKDEIIPSVFKVQPAYPNPFNSSTTIRYDIPKSSFVNIFVIDLLGRKVKNLVADGNVGVGSYQIKWRGFDDQGNLLPSGIYLIQFVSKDYSNQFKTVMIK